MTAMETIPLPADAQPFELDLIRPVARQTIRQWAERYIRVTSGPLVGAEGMSAAWSPDAFVLQSAVIDAIDDNRWAKVVLLTAPQAFGKTMCAAIPPLLHGIQHRGVSVMYVAANADLANAQWKDKIRPTIEAHHELNTLLFENPDLGGNRLRRDFTNGTQMHIVGSESVGNLSGKTAPVIVCDDVQAYPGQLPRFGHPADYAATRTGAFPSTMTTLIYAGTAGAADDWLWRTLRASAMFCPFVPCPACGAFQLIEFDRFVYDASNPSAALADTRMRCANKHCDHRITFAELPAMLRKHLWVSCPPDADWVQAPPESGVTIDPAAADVYPATRRNTNVAGFWCNAFYWPWGKTWGELAVEFISRAGDPEKLKDWQQNFRSVPYEPPPADEDALRPEDIKSHVFDGHKWGEIPTEAGFDKGDGVLVITADVMAGYVWYLVIAWNKRTGSSWVVELGKFGTKYSPKEFPDAGEREALGKSRVQQSLEALWAKDADGWALQRAADEDRAGTHIADLCFVDCGFWRDTVQLFCKLRNGGKWLGKWLPVFGSRSLATGKASLWPGFNAPHVEPKSKRRAWEINTNRAKVYVRDVLAVPVGRDGSLRLPADMPPYCRDQFARQLCAETLTPRGTWEKTSGENHLLDCLAMQVVAAYAKGVKLPFAERPAARVVGGYQTSEKRRAAGGWKIGRY